MLKRNMPCPLCRIASTSVLRGSSVGETWGVKMGVLWGLWSLKRSTDWLTLGNYLFVWMVCGVFLGGFWMFLVGFSDLWSCFGFALVLGCQGARVLCTSHDNLVLLVVLGCFHRSFLLLSLVFLEWFFCLQCLVILLDSCGGLTQGRPSWCVFFKENQGQLNDSESFRDRAYGRSSELNSGRPSPSETKRD